MTQEYWTTRKVGYMEMADHLQNIRQTADGAERKKLSKELERIYNEISFIEEECLK